MAGCVFLPPQRWTRYGSSLWNVARATATWDMLRTLVGIARADVSWDPLRCCGGLAFVFPQFGSGIVKLRLGPQLILRLRLGVDLQGCSPQC